MPAPWLGSVRCSMFHVGLPSFLREPRAMQGMCSLCLPRRGDLQDPVQSIMLSQPHVHGFEAQIV